MEKKKKENMFFQFPSKAILVQCIRAVVGEVLTCLCVEGIESGGVCALWFALGMKGRY